MRYYTEADGAFEERISVPEIDNILGREYPVLDDGFIRVVDYMGSDASIVQAARISYGSGTKQVHEDRGLIRYLMRHKHSTPFEMCEIKFHVRVPMDCWRQWIRHRTANVNEYSTRYSEAIDEMQKTNPSEWRLQSGNNKQGSDGFVDENTGIKLSRQETGIHDRARKLYQERLIDGVAREQARKDLPLSTYTEAYWKIDLHNLLHFLGLRMDDHAQHEIRQYANTIGKIASLWVPITWEAFKDYRLESITLSSIELKVLRAMAGGDTLLEAAKAGWLKRRKDGTLKPNREREEADKNFDKLGWSMNWDLPLPPDYKKYE